MPHPINRRAALCAGLTAAGSLWLPRSVRGADLPPHPLIIKNDLEYDIGVAVFHPDRLDQQYEMWSRVPAGQEDVLEDREGKPFIVGPDWGIRVVKNGTPIQSPIQRIINVGGGMNEAGQIICLASKVFDAKVAYSAEWHIRQIKGYTIDGRFGAKGTELLKHALGVFYQRFVQFHTSIMPELVTKAGTSFGNNFPKNDFMGVDESRDYLVRQLGRMRSSAGPKPLDRDVFPNLTLNFGNEVGGNWVARAPLGTVQVHLTREGGRYDGAFEMEINNAYLFSRDGVHYSDQNFWAGVIAHEALHNLGHLHPESRNDPGYYEHQMILIEAMVMSGGQVRYGDKNSTPVMCGGRPA